MLPQALDRDHAVPMLPRTGTGWTRWRYPATGSFTTESTEITEKK